jgi:hypothetical protein
MEVEGRKEKTLVFNSLEEVGQTIEEIRAVLTYAVKGKKPDKAGAQAWVDRVDSEIDQAIDLIKLQEQYPELKDAFVSLKALAERADDDLFRYGSNMGLPDYTHTD